MHPKALLLPAEIVGFAIALATVIVQPRLADGNHTGMARQFEQTLHRRLLDVHVVGVYTDRG